jgi:lipid-A-disaccharide synthase
VTAHVYIVAAEESGDAIGADLIDALRARQSDLVVSGIGGVRMADRGVRTPIDMSGIAVLGFVDGLRAFGRVKRLVDQAAREIARINPDAVVLIDSWGFMWRLASALKEAGVGAARIKLIGPQVWATRPGRARVLAQWCDHLLCIHDFEEPFYRRWGLPTTVIGNPALNRLQRGDGEAFRRAHAIAANERLIGLLPGSRRSEMRRVAPVLVEAATRLTHGRSNMRVVCIAAPSVAPDVRSLAEAWPFPHIIVDRESDKSDAMASLDVALACSGTITTELAGQGAPVVVGYKLGWITWAIARAFLMRSRYITLLNVAAGREIAPEFVQTRFSAARICHAAARLLDDPKLANEQKRAQAAALASMARDRPAAEIAAETILRLVAERSTSAG